MITRYGRVSTHRLLSQSHHTQFDFPAHEHNLVLSDKALDTQMTTVWCSCLFDQDFSFNVRYEGIV